jgi:5' nucleotidase family
VTGSWCGMQPVSCQSVDELCTPAAELNRDVCSQVRSAAQLVQHMDEGLLPPELGMDSYQTLWAAVQRAMFHTHVESTLKADIIREPEKYVQLDPDMAATLLDMREAGKRIILITNSDWSYTKSLMSFAYDRCAPMLSAHCTVWHSIKSFPDVCADGVAQPVSSSRACRKVLQ